MPYVVARFDPSVDIFFTPGVFVPLPKNVINKYDSGTLIIKNRSYFDLFFEASDGRSFYVEQEEARAFYFPDLQSWNFSYMPIDKSGLLSINTLLPYQQTTIELYLEHEKIIETYPQSYPVFSLASNEVLSRNSQLYLATSGVLTSPISGNLPFSLFWPASNTRQSTLTILSIKLSVSAIVQLDVKPTGSDPNRSSVDGGNSTNVVVSTTPALHVTHQNTTVTKVAGQSLITTANIPIGITEILSPAMITAQSQNYPTGGALGGGIECYMTPSAATTYSWSTLWKEENQ